MVDASSLAQIVLAAGLSQRMGQPKPGLVLGGKTLLGRVLEAAAVAGVGRSVIVVGERGAELEATHDLASQPLPVRFVTNTVPGSEQLESLQVGLRALAEKPPDGFFIHPVDCPLSQAGDYLLLIEAFCDPDAAAESVFLLSHNHRRGHHR